MGDLGILRDHPASDIGKVGDPTIRPIKGEFAFPVSEVPEMPPGGTKENQSQHL